MVAAAAGSGCQEAALLPRSVTILSSIPPFTFATAVAV